MARGGSKYSITIINHIPHKPYSKTIINHIHRSKKNVENGFCFLFASDTEIEKVQPGTQILNGTVLSK